MSATKDRMPSVEGVMVSYNYSEGADQANIITVAASGIKFSNRWVLTHGSILSPLKQAEILKKSKGKSILNEQFYYNLPEIYVTCEKGIDSLDKDYEGVTTLAAKRDERDLDLEHHSYQVRVLTGRICHVWQCPILDRCVDDILYSWTIGHRDGDMEKQTQLGKALLSVFVLVDLESDDRDFKTLRPLSELYDLVRLPPDRGADLEVHSTPFGCEVFLNGVTRGTVCGVVGRRPSLLLTDAATALGSEGAPVFTDTGSLIGTVVCSVSWWRGEWVGLTLVAPLHAVLGAKLHVPLPDVSPSDKDSRLRARSKLHQVILESLDRVVVLVRCGAAWGAGVYLGGGRALTAAHVVNNCEREKVSMYCQGVKETAIVIYKTAEEKAFDLALVYSNPENWAHLKPAHFATEPAKKGETVLAVGYPFFNENNLDSLKPMITRGHVNNVSPSMIQTSCCVQSGFSGGAICRLVERGGGLVAEVLGVIICNAKSSAACYPYINMAVPGSAFVQLLNQYYEDKDKSKLKEIEQKKDMIQSQWRLMPYRSKI